MNLCVENLSYSFDGVHDLWKDVSFAVGKGDIFSIMGANGAGKSTLLHTVIGFLRPKTGQVYLENEGQKIYADTAPKLFTENIGYVPQLSDTAYSFAVKDYVVMGRSPHMGFFSQPSAKDREMTDEVMRDMGLYEIRNRRFNTLSGGQQRQAVIARAIVQEPQLIIMDEPTNHLDYGNQFRVVEMIEKLSEKGITVILTTHMPIRRSTWGIGQGSCRTGSFPWETRKTSLQKKLWKKFIVSKCVSPMWKKRNGSSASLVSNHIKTRPCQKGTAFFYIGLAMQTENG